MELLCELLSLNERIYSSGGDLVITIQHSLESSTDDAISTFTRRNPYQTHLVGAGDSIIYSLLNYVSSPETTKLLQSLKGRGPYTVKPKQYDVFLDQLVGYATTILTKLRPETIVTPKSSSPFLQDFTEKLKRSYPKAKYVSEAFIKKALDAANVEPLINTSHPDWKKFADGNPKAVDDLKKSLQRQIKTHGALELKKLYKPYLKFIQNFVQIQKADEILDNTIGKRVLVLDDVLSSGATMVEMLRQLHDLEPVFLAGLTLFKRTTKTKE